MTSCALSPNHRAHFFNLDGKQPRSAAMFKRLRWNLGGTAREYPRGYGPEAATGTYNMINKTK